MTIVLLCEPRPASLRSGAEPEVGERDAGSSRAMCSSNLKARLGQDRGRNELDVPLTMRVSLIARALIPIWVTAKMARC